MRLFILYCLQWAVPTENCDNNGWQQSKLIDFAVIEKSLHRFPTLYWADVVHTFLLPLEKIIGFVDEKKWVVFF